jgi:hypothetical protein
VLIGYDGRGQPLDAGLDASPAVQHDASAIDPPASDADSATATGSRDAAMDGGGDILAPDSAMTADDARVADASEAEAGGSLACDTPLFGLCWYFSPVATSCRTTCTDHGGLDERATAYVGSSAQGGSLESCKAVLGALGASTDVIAGTRPDKLGLGCHQWTTGVTYWLNGLGQGFNPDDSGINAKLACGCLE